MENRVSIRADYPKDGKVIPISITTDCGVVWRIDSILSIQDGKGEVKYSCRIKDKNLTLIKRGDAWYMASDSEIK